MTNDNLNNQPAFRLYSVMERVGRKAQWTEIGAAWAHKDGHGFNVEMNATPFAGASLVLRAVGHESAA